MKRILIIAATINRKRKYFTGLAMMVELFNRVMSKHFHCVVCSISPQLPFIKVLPDFKVGSTTLLRLIDYVWLMLKSLVYIVVNSKSIVYLCPAPTKLGFYRDFIFVKVGIFFNCKIVLQIFTGDLGTLYDSLSIKNKQRFQWMYNRASLIVCEGQIETDYFKGFVENPMKVNLVENALPEDRKDKTTESKKLGTSPKLLFLNNMIVSKGYWDVLYAVDILVNKRGISVKCDFVGKFLDHDTTEETKFYAFIESHNLTKHVRFIPGAFGEEKKKLFEEASFFLLPSYFPKEGKPTAILEAMSYGCVPIVTNYREIPEMVNDTNGIFVEPQNPSDIANKIESILNDKDRYISLSANCLKDFEDKYTPEKYERKMYALFNAL